MKHFLLMTAIILSLVMTNVFAQTSPDYIFGNDNGSGWSWSTGTQGSAGLGGTYKWQFQATADGSLYYKYGETSSTGDGSGFWYVGTGGDVQYSTFGPKWTAYYHANMGDAGAFYFHTQTNNYYVMKTKLTGSDADFAIFDNGAAAPVTIAALKGTTSGGSINFDVTLSGSKSVNEKAWVRYTTDNWATSAVVEASSDQGSNVWRATISKDTKSYEYYAFTTINQSTVASADADFFSINSITNGGKNFRLNLAGNVLNYDMTVSSSAYQLFADGTAFTWEGTPDNDSDISNGTNIGFTFNYCGVEYTQFQVSSDGYIRLGNDHNTAVPPINTLSYGNLLSGRNRGVIAPFWDDLAVISSAADITYKVVDSTFGKVLIVQWNNVKWNYTASTVGTFQVVLSQADNSIQFRYGWMTGTSVSPSASIGFNDVTPIGYQPTISTNLHAASGTFQSVAMGGAMGSRTFYRSMNFEYNISTLFPDSNTVLTFLPFGVTPYSGTITVGTGGTFAKPSDAAVRLNVCGVSGPTTVSFKSGTIDDIFHLVMVPGLSSSNTLLLNGESGAHTAILSPRGGQYSSNTVTSGDQMLQLAGCQWVTVDGLDFQGNTADASTLTRYDIGIGHVVAQVWSGANITGKGSRNCVYKNINIDMKAVIAGVIGHGNATGIRFGTSFGWTDTTLTNSWNTIQDVNITGFWRSAIFLYGEIGNNPDKGNKITAVVDRNKIHDVLVVSPGVSSDIRPIEMNAQYDFVIEKTDIYNIRSDVNTTNGIMAIRINPAGGGDGFGGTCYIRDVKIDSLAMPNATVTSALLTGIELNAPTFPGTVLYIYNNRISNLYNNGNAGGSVRAMLINMSNVPSTVYCYNNLVYDIKGPRLTGNPAVRSFDVQGASVNLQAYLWNNTAYIDNTTAPSIANHSSCNLYLANMGTASIELKNNIFVNTMSAGTTPTTGRACNIFASANSNLIRIAPTSNNNLYWAGTPSATKPIAWDVATSFNTLATYQAALTSAGLGGPREMQSVTEMPPFVSSVYPYNVNINTATATQANNSGLPITSPVSVTTDFAGTARSATFPDMGAYEFAGTSAADAVGPNVVYTALTNTALTSNRNFTATITDPSGIGSGADLPRVYYKKNWAGTLVNSAPPSVSGNDYTWTVDYTLVDGGSVTAGDSIWYYVAAQDAAGTPNLTAVPTGATGTTPPGAVSPLVSTGFRAYKIVGAPLAGTYTVGLTAFNKVTGLNLYSETRTRKVTERVREPRDIQPAPQKVTEGNVAIANTDPTASFGYDFDTLKFYTDRYIMKEVEQEYSVLMKDGQEYTGPTFYPITLNDLSKIGQDPVNYKEVKGIYATITAAFQNLNESGVSGATTLSLVDAAYSVSETFPLTLTSIAGVSATNTITIKPAASMVSAITGSNATSLFQFVNTPYVTVDGSNSGGTDRSLALTNGAAGSLIRFLSLNNVTVNSQTAKNLVLNAFDNTVSHVGVWDFWGSGNAGYFNGVTVQNCLVTKGRQAVFVNGGIGPQNITNLTIQDNFFASTGASQLKIYGIYLQGVDGATIKNNDIGFFETTSAEADRGIWVALGAKNITIERNKIHDLSTGAGFGGNAIYLSTSLSDANILIKNNFIYNILGPGSNTVNQNPIGVFISNYSHDNKIYNNTFYLNGATLSNTGSSGAAYSAAVSLSTGAKADVRNNIIFNSLGKTPTSSALNGQLGVFAFNTMDQFTTLDYNVYYFVQKNSTYTSIGHVNGINDIYSGPAGGAILTAFQSAFGKDLNSKWGDPRLADTAAATSNLHIDTLKTTVAAGAAQVLASVTDDFDGNPRTGTPTVGADEANAVKATQTLSLTALIQGYTDAGSGLMPKTDTLKAYLCNSTAPYAAVDSATVALATNGTGTATFNNVVNVASYYLKLNHWNSIRTWSALAQPLANTMSYNFTSDVSQAYNSNQVLVGSKACMYNGDANQDGQVTLDDLLLVDADNQNFVTGYTQTDMNGDEQVTLDDLLITDQNNQNFVSANEPAKLVAKPRVKDVQTKKIKNLNIQE